MHLDLPTENYAIKMNTHPREITDQNIAKSTNQLKSVGFSFDWSRDRYHRKISINDSSGFS